MAPLFACRLSHEAWVGAKHRLRGTRATVASLVAHKVAKCERAHDCFLLSCPQKRGIMSSKEIWETENWYGQRNKGE